MGLLVCSDAFVVLSGKKKGTLEVWCLSFLLVANNELFVKLTYFLCAV